MHAGNEIPFYAFDYPPQRHRRCRTPDSGQMLLHCSRCSEQSRHPQSCGYRNCPNYYVLFFSNNCMDTVHPLTSV